MQAMTACDIDCGLWMRRYPTTRRSSHTSHIVIVRCLCLGLFGFLISRHGFVDIHCHSLRAVSNTEDSKDSSRDTDAGLTERSRESRNKATSAPLTFPMGLSSGSRYRSNAARRVASHLAPLFFGATSSAYLRSASRSVYNSPVGFSASSRISVSRRAAHSTASLRVRNDLLSLTPLIFICARYPCVVFWMLAIPGPTSSSQSAFPS